MTIEDVGRVALIVLFMGVLIPLEVWTWRMQLAIDVYRQLTFVGFALVLAGSSVRNMVGLDWASDTFSLPMICVQLGGGGCVAIGWTAGNLRTMRSRRGPSS